jgi:hypothetical protein
LVIVSYFEVKNFQARQSEFSFVFAESERKMDEEQCPICFRAFAIELLPSHVDACLSGGGGSRGGSRHASPAHTSGTYDVRPIYLFIPLLFFIKFIFMFK